jgi:peroxiredoxin
MKKICLILFLFAQVAFAQNSIIHKFINAVEKADVIQYTTKYRFINATDTTNMEGKVAIGYDQKDTLIGGYYFVDDYDNSKWCYTGRYYYEYYPKYLGENIVKVYDKKKNPKEFTGYEINLGGKKAFAPSMVKGLQMYKKSILSMYTTLKSNINKYESVSVIDTVMSGNACYMIFQDSNYLAFDKKNNMLIYCKTVQYPYSEEAVFYDFSFNGIKRKDVFSKKGFPKKSKFKEKVKYIEIEQLKNGTKVPDWELTSIDNRTISLSHYLGKPLLLEFSEVGCIPCSLSIPILDSLAKENKNINVVSIYPVNSMKVIKDFTAKEKIGYEVLCGTKAIANDYHVQGYPYFFLIDEKGILRYIMKGFSDDLKNILDSKINTRLKK